MELPTESTKHDRSKPGQTAGRLRRWMVLLVVCLTAFGAYFLFIRESSNTGKQAKNPGPPAVPVVAAAAKKSDVGVYVIGLGSVTALQTVTVKSRVDGQLMKVLFKEGQIVNSGDLLAVIDPRPFEVQLTQAEGQMARDRALLQNALLDLERYQVLWEQDSISKQQLDTQESLVHQYEGSLKVDQGQIDNAKLQLVYCNITAPISGRIGLRLVDAGNIIHATDPNGLLVITQVEPVTVIFPIPEDSLPQVLARLRTGESLQVEAYDREMKRRLAVGSLLTVDNQIDPNTGTVRLKAVFPNKDHELFPNQFVNARLLLEVRREEIVVPAAAIQRGPQGSFVYVVKADQTATVRPITISEIQGGEASVKTGLTPGEMVVVDGAERLREGSRVELRTEGSTTPQNAGVTPRGY